MYDKEIAVVSPNDDQSILIETSSCNLELFATQLRDFHMCHRKLSLLNEIYVPIPPNPI